ncbi:hypothetical protein [Microbacterium sp. Se63.02b]|uniref:hypothetical protein n=1 Tax=Microbacterium sp. Se63.02b TaxID=2709304 RepID=UPI0016051C3F|nr:hypothetical protein [Microbacterium sp. Se63.02b]QNA93626.1 hypothetical protein G4G29_17340 [Microbacterium sp. Se63.02b]
MTDAATGEPVSGESVRAQSLVTYSTVYGRTQADGSYRIVVGSPGAWDVSAADASTTYSTSTRRITLAGADLKDITFALAKGQRLSGKATAENTSNPCPASRSTSGTPRGRASPLRPPPAMAPTAPRPSPTARTP